MTTDPTPVLRILVSYARAKQVDLSLLDDYDGPVELFADSGAFSVRSLGITIRLADYAAWLRDWRGLITTAASLDVIGDHAASARNLRALHDRGLNVLPVFHLGTPWPELDALCRDHRYLALGGMVPASSQYQRLMRWLVRCFRTAREHDVVYHGFGQTALAVLSRLPFYTVDSSTWSTGGRYAQVTLFDPRTARFVTIRYGNREQVYAHRSLIRAHGGDPAWVASRTFAIRAGQSDARYRAELTMSYGMAAVAMMRMQHWLQDRHKVAPPPGWRTPGTSVFVTISSNLELHYAMHAVRAARDANHPTALPSRP